MRLRQLHLHGRIRRLLVRRQFCSHRQQRQRDLAHCLLPGRFAMFASHLADALDFRGRQLHGKSAGRLAAARFGHKKAVFRRQDRAVFQVPRQKRETARLGPDRDPRVARMAIGELWQVIDFLNGRPDAQQRQADAASLSAAGLRFPPIPSARGRARIARQRRHVVDKTEKPLHTAIENRLLRSRFESPFDVHVHPLPLVGPIGADLRNRAGCLRLGVMLRGFVARPNEDRDHVDVVPVAAVDPGVAAIRGDFRRGRYLLILLPAEPAVGRWIHANLDASALRHCRAPWPVQFQATELHAPFP